MKKSIKIMILCILVMAMWGVGSCVEANSISKIDMDIYIDSYGNAKVTETWECEADNGTEYYHPYYNLGNSKVTNLTVKSNGKEYETVPFWDIKGTLQSKAYTCGIHYIEDGLEICWGMNDYGAHTYIVQYTITDFIAELTDSQMAYWTLIPQNFSDTIQNAHIKIYMDTAIPDMVGVWGYGDYGAPTYVADGVIEMYSNEGIHSEEYMTILVQFPAETFYTTNTLHHDFQYYLDMAEKDAKQYQKENLVDIIMIICIVGIFGIALGCIIVVGSNNGFDYGKEGKKFLKKAPYFRDIPCKGELKQAYYIAYQYGINKNQTDILGAFILQWIKDGIISVEKRKTEKKEETVIHFHEKQEENRDGVEQEIFQMLKEASTDGYLKEKEFKKWCDKNHQKILKYFEGKKSILEREKQKLVKKGIVGKQDKKIGGIKLTKYTATPELRQMALEIEGLKRFLLDYTLVPEREAIEVHLLEEYLIFAQMLGIANKVAEQFKNIYPHIIEETVFHSYDTFLWIRLYANSGIQQAQSARDKAAGYTAGGGGFASGGGGFGSFGGRNWWWRCTLK